MRELVARALALIDSIEGCDRIQAAELEEGLAETLDLDAPRAVEAALRVAGAVLHASVRTAHPRCFGWFTPTPHPAAAVADLLTSALNPQLAVEALSPGPVAIERRLVGDLGRALGLPASRGGALTSGGAEANAMATTLALTHRIPGFAERGLPGSAPPTLYLSEQAHHSFEKIARSAGLGRGALRWIPTDERLAMDAAALARAIARDRAHGCAPFLVVATAGTTNTGAIDPLRAIADMCAREGLWLHVDAASAGALALSPALAPILDGIGRADSITIDPHKWLAMPLGTGALCVREASSLRPAFAVSADYRGPATDPYVTSMQWSRRFAGLRLLLPLLLEGWPAFARRVERQVAVGAYLRERVAADGWTVLHETPLPIVCFARPGAEPSAVAERVNAGGRAWICATRVRSRPALRACVSSHLTREDDVDQLVRALRDACVEEPVRAAR